MRKGRNTQDEYTVNLSNYADYITIMNGLHLGLIAERAGIPHPETNERMSDKEYERVMDKWHAKLNRSKLFKRLWKAHIEKNPSLPSS